MTAMKGIRAVLAVLPLLLGVTACSSLSQGSIEALRLAFAGTAVKLDESALDPASAYLVLQANDGELIMGRGFSDQGLETWYGAGQELLSLRHGVVAGSLGMTRNLADVQWLGVFPWLQGISPQALPVTYSRHIDRLPAHFNEVTEYRLEDQGLRKLKIWGQTLEARQLQEHVVSSNARHPLPGNTYWLNAEGEVVQSRQWLAPDYDILLKLRPQSPAAVPAVQMPPAQIDATATRHMMVIVEPTRLNVLLRNHPLPQAWLPGSAWLVRGEEMSQHQRKRGVLFDIDKAFDEKKLSSQESDRLRGFRARLADMPVTGRKLLPALNARWLQGNQKQDPQLNGGDRLMRPLLVPADVQVMGNVPQDCFLPVTPDLTLRQAVAACINDRFLPDQVFYIAPDGRVTVVETAVWNRAPDRGVMPGSRLLVPFSGLAEASGNPRANADLAEWLATQIDPVAAPARMAPQAGEVAQ